MPDILLTALRAKKQDFSLFFRRRRNFSSANQVLEELVDRHERPGHGWRANRARRIFWVARASRVLVAASRRDRLRPRSPLYRKINAQPRIYETIHSLARLLRVHPRNLRKNR